MGTHKEKLTNEDVLTLSTSLSCCLSRPSQRCLSLSIPVVNKIKYSTHYMIL